METSVLRSKDTGPCTCSELPGSLCLRSLLLPQQWSCTYRCKFGCSLAAWRCPSRVTQRCGMREGRCPRSIREWCAVFRLFAVWRGLASLTWGSSRDFRRTQTGTQCRAFTILVIGPPNSWPSLQTSVLLCRALSRFQVKIVHPPPSGSHGHSAWLRSSLMSRSGSLYVLRALLRTKLVPFWGGSSHIGPSTPL